MSDDEVICAVKNIVGHTKTDVNTKLWALNLLIDECQSLGALAYVTNGCVIAVNQCLRDAI